MFVCKYFLIVSLAFWTIRFVTVPLLLSLPNSPRQYTDGGLWLRSHQTFFTNAGGRPGLAHRPECANLSSTRDGINTLKIKIP